MGWFVSVEQEFHPCFFPLASDRAQHRPGEFWRCETCDALWILSTELSFRRATPKQHRKHRKDGYTDDPVS